MNELENTPFEAHFLEGSKGRLFGLYFPAIGKPRGQILCIPPFAEESNRSRVMLGLGARALAHQGYGTLILDLYGTGDSEGLFEQASWSIWLDDMDTAIHWLQAKAKQDTVTLWGTRLSALLAVDSAQANLERVSRLLFWQPVANGKMMFTQYLRLRVANSLDNNGRKESTKGLRERLAAGESLEVGGYYISPQIAADLDSAAMPATLDGFDTRIDWLEATDPDKTELAVGSMKFINGWKAQGKDIHPRAFNGPLFWQLHERFLVPNLIEATLQAMTDG